MPIPTYTPGYPPDGSSLGQTKTTIRNNLDGTFETLAIDHIDNNGQPGSQPAGYHKVIHEVTQTSVSTVAGVNQVFSGVPGTLVVNAVTTPTIPPGGDTQLYSLSGAGVLSQLTGKVANANGYAWVGGILLQWGSTSAADNTSVPFTIPFPNNCFNVQVTVNYAGAPSTGLRAAGINNPTFNVNNFTFRTSGGVSAPFVWFAIGN